MTRLAFLYLVLGSFACGPSLQQSHVSTAQYEQCYASDYDPGVSSERRTQCWARWLAEYADGQPPERVEFAQERLRRLEADGSARPLPDAAPVPARSRDHEYPPPPPGAYHTSGCDPLCDAAWSECTSRCDLRDKPCKTGCESEFRICVEGCP
ncbi:MAG: hypothetical protein AAF500_11275 [Myxococcota bacterium]